MARLAQSAMVTNSLKVIHHYSQVNLQQETEVVLTFENLCRACEFFRDGRRVVGTLFRWRRSVDVE
jgi:hypothetical protein